MRGGARQKPGATGGHAPEHSRLRRLSLTLGLALLCVVVCAALLREVAGEPAPGARAVILPGHEAALMAALMPRDGPFWPDKRVDIRIEGDRITLIVHPAASDPLSILILARAHFASPRDSCTALDDLWLCPDEDRPLADELMAAYTRWLKDAGRSAQVAAVWSTDAPFTAYSLVPDPARQLVWLVLLLLAWAAGERRQRRDDPARGGDWPAPALVWLFCLALFFSIATASAGHGPQGLAEWLPVGALACLIAYRLAREPDRGGGRLSRAFIPPALLLLALALLWPMLGWEPAAGYEVNRLEIARSGLVDIVLNEHRNPLLYYLFLKLSLAVLPLPVALHAVSVSAAVIGVAVFAHALTRFGVQPLAAGLAAVLLLLSPAFAHYGADTHPMSLGLLWIILAAWMLREKRATGAALFSLLAIYTVHPAWLFVPAFWLSFRRRFQRGPGWWWWLLLAPAAWVFVRSTVSAQTDGTPAFAVYYGLPWIGGTGLDVALSGLSYMSPGGAVLGGLALWALALHRGIWSPSRWAKREALAYAAAPVFLFLAIPFVRLRSEHIAVVLVPLAFYGLTTLHGLNRRGLRLWLVAVLALALGGGAPALFTATPGESLRDGLSREIPENVDVWTVDPSQARLLAYERNPDTLGAAWRFDGSPVNTYRNGTGTILSLIDWFEDNPASGDEAARALVRIFADRSAGFYVIMDERYRFSAILGDWLKTHCQQKARQKRLTLFHCVP